jgi:hypothetical protein
MWADPSVQAESGRSVGPALDLTRTNELLQQLLDEVRRDRQPYLPVARRNERYE